MEQQTWIGRSLNGRYKIEALLGQGGMSAVYKAMDPNLKRVVAIKLIHPHLLSDEDFIYRFKREASAVAAFRHPHIVQVYDFNNDGDVYYMVLEYVPGETLQDRLKHLKKSERKMPFDQAARIMINMCDALGYAHRQGLIHRDIKPANIMLDTHGQAILMDFGIVKILDATSHTSTGAVMGTARYMSPEIIRSEVADERSDLYSLGVTFYEMLSGDPPFEADSAMSLLMRHLNDPVPDLSTKRQDMHPELIRIVNKALEKDRKDRYQSAEEMLEDLKGYLSVAKTAPIPQITPTPQTDFTQAETRKSSTEPKEQPADETEAWDVSSSSPASMQETVEVDEKTIPDISEETVKKDVQVQKEPKLQPPKRGMSLSKILLYCGIGLGVIIVIWGGLFFANRASTSSTDTLEPVATQTETTIATSEPTEESVVVAPTEIPTDTPIPLTATPSTPYVLITSISLDGNTYVVDYEVHNFPEAPQLHVHMFFNTVPPENAGLPATGPWKLTWGPYGDPPFTQYGTANRPAGATQMCSLVANANHTVILESGNCYDLPDG